MKLECSSRQLWTNASLEKNVDNDPNDNKRGT